MIQLEKKASEIYSDFAVNLQKNILTGDIIKKKNGEDIKQSLNLLFRTRYYDRCWHPEIGTYIPNLLFKLDHPYEYDILKEQITRAIDRYEPRITLNNIFIGHKENGDEENGIVTISLEYTINAIGMTDTYTYTVSRVR